MRVIVVGPGRAGTALAMAAHAAGHEVVAVMARRMEAAEDAAASLGAARAVLIGNDVPPSDLIVVATRDDTISEVAGEIAPSVREAGGVVHISGLASKEALAPARPGRRRHREFSSAPDISHTGGRCRRASRRRG